VIISLIRINCTKSNCTEDVLCFLCNRTKGLSIIKINFELRKVEEYFAQFYHSKYGPSVYFNLLYLFVCHLYENCKEIACFLHDEYYFEPSYYVRRCKGPYYL